MVSCAQVRVIFGGETWTVAFARTANSQVESRASACTATERNKAALKEWVRRCEKFKCREENGPLSPTLSPSEGERERNRPANFSQRFSDGGEKYRAGSRAGSV